MFYFAKSCEEVLVILELFQSPQLTEISHPFVTNFLQGEIKTDIIT